MIVDQFKVAVDEASAKLIEEAAGYVKFMFSKGSLPPCIFFTKAGKIGHMLITEFDERVKDPVAHLIRELKKDAECVVFVSESWLTETKLAKNTPRDRESIHKIVEAAPTPSQSSDRKEIVSLMVYVGTRTILLAGAVSHNPNAVGEFDYLMDSAWKDELMGRFFE